MYWVLIVLHVFVCAFLVLVVLLQAGKGGGMGIAFGGGGSQTVFGSSGAGNFLTRMTAICATVFFLNSLGLAYLSSRSDSSRLQRLAEQEGARPRSRAGRQDQGDQGRREGARGAEEEGSHRLDQRPRRLDRPGRPTPPAAPASAPARRRRPHRPPRPRPSDGAHSRPGEEALSPDQEPLTEHSRLRLVRS